MGTLNAMTFEGFLVPVALMLAIIVAPSASAFFLLSHFLHWGKSEAGALFAFGLFIDFVIRYGYGRATLISIFKVFMPRPSAAKPDEKTKAAQAAVELEKRKKEAAEGADAHVQGEVHTFATPDE